MKCLTEVYGESSVANPDGKGRREKKIEEDERDRRGE